MRASPAFHIDIERFAVWRGVIVVLLLVTSGGFLAWWMSPHLSASWPARAVSISVAAAVLCGAASLWRCAPTRLRWDTQRWSIAPASQPDAEASTGRLSVALDLGPWMLLKFEHDVTSRRARTTWLPVQRRGLEAHWHALRCAVYCARPAQGHDAGRRTAVSPESQE